MKNLKRILSLALASVMVMGMMVVGASAAYKDQDQIDSDHANAVAIIDALNIMNGNPDGTFNPKGELTRAELATVISTLLNRGVAPNYGTKDKPSFSDIDGHWGESFIEYVYSMKAMNGVGGNRFNPDAPLTATTAARTILNAMGYSIADPSNWELLTEIQARQEDLDLYDGLDAITDPSHDHITREQVAQMVNNALDAPMEGGAVETSTVYVLGTETNGKFVANTAHGIFETAADAAAYNTTNNLNLKIGRQSQTITENMAKKYLNVDTSTAAALKSVKLITSGSNKGKYKTVVGNTEYIVAEDYSNLMGQTVQVLTKGGKVNQVYGIVDAGGAVIFNGTVGEYRNSYDAATGDLKTDMGNVALYVYNDYATSAGTVAAPNANAKNEYTLKVIADAYGDPSVGIVTPAVLSRVTYVGSSSITLTPAVNGIASYKTAEYAAFDGMSRGDYVVAIPGAYTVDGKTALTEAESISGQITSQRTNGAGSVRVNGTWYVGASNLALALGDKGTMYLVNGIIAKVDEDAAATSNDLAVIVAVDSDDGNDVDQTAGSNRVRIMLADGSMVIATVDPDSEVKGITANLGKLVTYTVEDNKYSFEEVAAGNLAGYDDTKDSIQLMKNGTLTNGLRIADDATVVIIYNTSATVNNKKTTGATAPASKPLNEDITAVEDEYDAHVAAETVTDWGKLGKTKVLTGKEVKAWGTAGASGALFGATVGYAMVNEVNGIDYAKLVVLAADTKKLPDATAGAANYGWVISNDGNEYVDRATYTKYTIWNGSENIEVLEKGVTNKKAGNIVTFAYTDAAKGYVQITDESTNFTTGAVTGYSEADDIIKLLKADNTPDGTVTKVDDHTVLFFIDSANKAGVVGGEIQLATVTNGITFANIKYVAGGTGRTDTVDVAFIDVANNWAGTDGIAKAPEAAITTDKTFVAADAGKVFTFGTNGSIAGQGTPASGWEKMVAIAFDGAKEFGGVANSTVQGYTLTIYNTAGNMVYREVAPSTTSAAAHVFYLDKTGTKLNADTVNYPTLNAAGKASGTILKDGCSYSFTIIGNTDGRTYASGAFTMPKV